MENVEEVTRCIKALDELLPTTNCFLRAETIGVQVYGNQLGYLRLGVEFLKLATKQDYEHPKLEIEEKLWYLMKPGAQCCSAFHFVETDPFKSLPKQSGGRFERQFQDALWCLIVAVNILIWIVGVCAVIYGVAQF